MNTVPKRLPDMTQLEPFNPEAHCPKCGHTDVDAKYCVYIGAFSNTKREWLRRGCRRCGFLWDEAVLGSSTPDQSWNDDEDEDWNDDQAEPARRPRSV